MKKVERESLMRLLTDLVSADSIFDLQMIESYNLMLEKFDLSCDDGANCSSISFQFAIACLKKCDVEVKIQILDELKSMVNRGRVSSRRESLLILAIKYGLFSANDNSVEISSVDMGDLTFVDSQIAFVEVGYNNIVNADIAYNYRQISKEVKLVGFNFLYIPQVVNSYCSSPNRLFEKSLAFLSPHLSQTQRGEMFAKFSNTTTAQFCKSQLQERFKIGMDFYTYPSLLLMVGSSLVDGKNYINLLKMELRDSVLSKVNQFVDDFSVLNHSHSSAIAVNRGLDGAERIIYNGFYKLLFDSLTVKQKSKSPIVIDIVNEEILFASIGEKLSGIHRREKALYTLFLLEHRNGGINFTKPENIKMLKEHEKNLMRIQNRYNAIYALFGGEAENAPDLSISEIRLPMISRIKRGIMKLKDSLINVEDYIVTRYKNGDYNLAISELEILCVDVENRDRVDINESESFGSLGLK